MILWAYPREYKDKSSAAQRPIIQTDSFILPGALQFIGLLKGMWF